MIWLRWIWDNPLARWVGLAISFLIGWELLKVIFRFAFGLASRGAVRRERQRQQIEQERAINERVRQSQQTQDRANEIRNTNASREHPFDSMSDASRSVLFGNQ